MGRYEQQIAELPLGTARAMALTRLEQDAEFECTRNDDPGSVPTYVPGELRALLIQYRAIFWLGIAWISLDDLAFYPAMDGYYVIGEDTESPLVFRPPDERIAIWGDNKVSSEYPSVYHWIMALKEDETQPAG